MLDMIEVKINDKRIGAEFAMPNYKTEGAAAIDLIACLNEPLTLLAGDPSVLIDSGISVYVGNKDYVALILPRSGLGNEGLILGNTCGVIDADYQGNLLISAWNRHKSNPITIEPGMRIAQLMFVPVAHPTFKLVENFSDITKRGEGGFGSTGRN